MWRVCAASREPRRRNSQVSSEWKRTVARFGEAEPWCRTTIQARPLRSRFATNTLKAACASSLPAKAPIGPNAGIPVRSKWAKARGFEPCSCPNAQP
jgi:hypothetical protein